MTAQEAFELLYNGTGVVYVTDDTGLLSPYASVAGLKIWDEGIENGPDLQGKLLEIFSTNSGYSVTGYANSLCTMTLAGANNCTAVNVGGVNQLSGPIAMIAADIPGSVAAIVAEINSYNVVPASDNCRAVQVGNSFYLVETVGGDSHNGEAVTITFSTVASAATGTSMAGGRAAGGRPYRIFLDPSPTASLTVLNPASAVEITSVASFKGLEAPAVSQNVVVTTNSVVFNRTSSFMQVYIDGVTTVGAANRVDSILGLGSIEGDVVILSGIDGSTPPIINTGSLTYLEYVRTLTGYASTLAIRMAEDGNWYQTTPNPSSSASLRASGIPTPLQPGVFQMAPAAGTATIAPGFTGTSAFPGLVYEPDVALTGTAVLAASLNFVIETANAIPGDTGTISGNNQAITIGANSVNFSGPAGIVATLPEQMALSGQWVATWTYLYYDPILLAGIVAWQVSPAFSTTHTQFLETTMYENLSVTGAKIDNATIDGATKLIDDSVDEVKLDAIVRAKLNVQGRNLVPVAVSSAEMLAINTTRKLAIAAPGVGKAIVVTGVYYSITYIAPIYATNLNLQIICDTATAPQAESVLALIKTTNAIESIPMTAVVAAGETQIIENEAVYITVSVGDPTAGGSNFTFFVEYMILDV